ncbi:D-isomer specific 2-hydroxyacid dehydrogenase [Caballeronia fortuita]|uniref:D-isomer specific 2-hydroxyacid dehydrogenase n=1 Tax=Caballeronia fortuita TaxID=1777138 RepID=A0A157ZU29_9BURK|nr:glyoxylate/hydroxypyruvate reductase A [Caballeronia fortuita]SAK49054.1 D-isomer specific 2-hydroxyacid dehydrogenase [Caballeronia fortuita]
MDILMAVGTPHASRWMQAVQCVLPEAHVRAWRQGDDEPADYALVWKCDAAALKPRAGLKAVFNLGAGVDALLAMLPGVLVEAPIYRLEDAGMAQQMADYARYGVLHHMRRFEAYRQQAARGEWKALDAMHRRDMPIGVMGLGSLGEHVARTLAADGFIVRGYSRSTKTIDGIQTFGSPDGLDAFLEGLHVLVNLLPATADTHGLINARTLARLADNACVINLARGMHVHEADLLDALDSGKLAFAMLDVFTHEPLDAAHPFWRHPRVMVTPHISAVTLIDDSARQVADKIAAIEAGRAVTGRVDPSRGY